MALELVPIEGERVLTEEEVKWHKFRTRNIPPEAIRMFNPEQQKEIKIFLARLVAISEQCQHTRIRLDKSDDSRLEYLVVELEKLNSLRIKLFSQQPTYIKSFCDLVALCASEPWKEFEEFLNNIREEEMQQYRDTSRNSGIAAAMDNPFLLQMDDDLDEKRMDVQIRCRITPYEIESLILHHSLEKLVNHLINARRVGSGEFWDRGFYDL